MRKMLNDTNYFDVPQCVIFLRNKSRPNCYEHVPRRKPWITPDIQEVIKLKNIMYKKLKVHGDMSLVKDYKCLKNKLCNVIRKAEKMYYKNLLDSNKHNMFKTWKTLNLVINRNKNKARTTSFKHNNILLTDNDKIVSQFNKYFANIVKKSSDDIPITHSTGSL